MSEAPTPEDLAAAFAELREADQQAREARDQHRLARIIENAAINRVSEAQKAIDKMLAEIKRVAQPDSVWYQNAKENRGQPA